MIKKILMTFILIILVSACTDYREVPLSTVGMVVDKSGVSEDILPPGNYDIGHQWRITKTLVLLDTSIETIPLTLKLRLADNQELGVQLLVKTRIETENKQTLKGMFGIVTPIATASSYTKKIPLTLVYSKLGQDLVRRSATEVITPHTLESFRQERKSINDILEVLAKKRLEDSPLELLSATINKVTYPSQYMVNADNIKEKELSKALKIAEEEAKRAALLEEEATIEIDKRVRIAKAEIIKAENLATAGGLNPMLLEYEKIQLEKLRLEVDMAFATAAKTNGNSTIFYPTGQKPDYVEATLLKK